MHLRYHPVSAKTPPVPRVQDDADVMCADLNMVYGCVLTHVGESGAGKSSMLQEFAVRLAGNINLPDLDIKRRTGKVLYIYGEQDHGTISDSLTKWSFGHGIELPSANIDMVEIDAVDVVTWGKLLHDKAEGYDLVIVDTATSNFGEPENEDVFAYYWRETQRYAFKYGFCGAIIHHPTKPQSDRPKKITQLEPRGNGGIRNKTDFITAQTASKNNDGRIYELQIFGTKNGRKEYEAKDGTIRLVAANMRVAYNQGAREGVEARAAELAEPFRFGKRLAHLVYNIGEASVPESNELDKSTVKELLSMVRRSFSEQKALTKKNLWKSHRLDFPTNQMSEKPFNAFLDAMAKQNLFKFISRDEANTAGLTDTDHRSDIYVVPGVASEDY